MIVHNKGMHEFIIDELEMGTRVALGLDTEYFSCWSALDDLRLEVFLAEDGLGLVASGS